MPERLIESYKGCRDCQTMVKMGAGIRLLEHLKAFHRHNDVLAHAFVNWIFAKFAEARRQFVEKINQA